MLMRFPKTVISVGNSLSLGITIPKEYRKAFEIKRGDIIYLRITSGSIETEFLAKVSMTKLGRIVIPIDVVKMLELKAGTVYVFEFIKNLRDGKK